VHKIGVSAFYNIAFKYPTVSASPETLANNMIGSIKLANIYLF
jgi:hypothetical protein